MVLKKWLCVDLHPRSDRKIINLVMKSKKCLSKSLCLRRGTSSLAAPIDNSFEREVILVQDVDTLVSCLILQL